MRFYILLDTSGSMEGAKIAALNEAMSNIVTELKHSAGHGLTPVTLAVLSFGKETVWMQGGSVAIEDFEWSNLTHGGMTPLGKACLELNSLLQSERAFAGEERCIVVLSDGCPTDDYDEGIETLQSDQLFVNARRYAIAIGDDADIPSLLRFTGDVSHIFQQSKSDELLDLFQNILYSRTRTVETPSSAVAEDSDDEWS